MTDAQKHGTESLLLITDATRSCLESAEIASRAILRFGGDAGSNMEGLVSMGAGVFYIVLIGHVDDNKDCFEDTDYNKPICIFFFFPVFTSQHTREDATALSFGCIRPAYNLKYLALERFFII